MKKILFVTYDFPFPTNTGGKNRAYHMLKYSKGDFKKYLFSFVRVGFNGEGAVEIDKIGVEIAGTILRSSTKDLKHLAGVISGKSIFKSLYFSKQVLDELVKFVIENKIDIIHFESFYTAFYLSDQFKDLGVKQIYGSENIEFKLYEDFAKGKGILKPVFDIQVKKIKKEEIEMYKKSDAVLAVTADEVKFIKSYNEKAYEIPNGIDIKDFKFITPTENSEKNLLFVGNFTYFPNVASIEDFYKNVFTRIKGDVKLTVIGKKVGSLSFISDPKVVSIDFVEDIRDAYSRADIMVSPVKIGGGTNFKILEAMAAGVPVVAYEGRLSAIGAKDGEHVMSAKDDDDFAKKIEKLLSDIDLRKKLAKSAREFVEQRYSWEKIGSELAKVWNSL